MTLTKPESRVCEPGRNTALTSANAAAGGNNKCNASTMEDSLNGEKGTVRAKKWPFHVPSRSDLGEKKSFISDPRSSDDSMDLESRGPQMFCLDS